MNKEQMILEIIAELLEANEKYINGIYEVFVNEDYDYIPDLFVYKEDFEEFIEKYKPKKCCVGEEE